MKKLLSIILSVTILCSLTACGGNDKDANIKPIDPTTATQATTLPDIPEKTPDETKPTDEEIPKNNNGEITMEFIDFDRSFLNLEEVWTFDAHVSLITFQTNKTINEEMIEKFETEEDFMRYINTYGDVEDHSEDDVTIQQTENGTEFSYSHGWGGAMSSGYDLDFYFIAHKDIPGGYNIDTGETYFDKTTGNMYFTLEKEEYTKENGTNTCGILYVSFDEEFIEENTINKIYIVLPEKTEKIELDGSEGNKHGLYEFMEFDRSILDIPEVGMFDINASFIDIPTTKTVEKSVMEKFTTQEELLDYLKEYGDVLDHTNDTATIKYNEDGVEFNASICGGMTFSSGFDLEFYFLAHPDMPANYGIDTDEIYYDEATKTAYIMLVREGYQNDENAKTTCGIFYLSFDEDFVKEKGINKIYFVMPE